MEIDQKLDPPVHCRLCGSYGDHRFEIFDSSAGDSSSSLSEKILRCLDIEVILSDPTTVICAECFNKLFGYDEFREVCHATNRKIKNSFSRHQNGVGSGVVFKANVKCEAVAEPVVTYLVSDSESNGESDELAIPENLTMKIEKSEDDSVAQENDSAVSSADDIPVIASTSSTFVKHERSENAIGSPKLETIGNEETVNFIMVASGTDTQTRVECGEDEREVVSTVLGDSRSVAHGSSLKTGTYANADEVSHIARVPRKKVVREMRSSMPTVTIKKEPHVNKKTKRNALKFPIKCSSRGVCRESFESREAMKLHVDFYHKKHAEKTFCCHLCKKTVVNRSYLERHMNSLHTQKVCFMCPNRECSKIFTEKGSLKRHMNAMHKNQDAFKCPKCSKTFLRELLLKKHLAIDHGDGIAFVCHLCEKLFKSKRILKSHIKFTHTEVTLHKCPETTCSKSFKLKFNMKRHFKAVHSRKKMHKMSGEIRLEG